MRPSTASALRDELRRRALVGEILPYREATSAREGRPNRDDANWMKRTLAWLDADARQAEARLPPAARLHDVERHRLRRAEGAR